MKQSRTVGMPSSRSPAAALRNELPPHRRGLVTPRKQLLAQLGPVLPTCVSLSSPLDPSPSPATMTPADFSLRSRVTLSGAQRDLPRLSAPSFTARSPDFRRLSLGIRGFAAIRPLAPLGVASDPTLVHRPAVSLPASSPRSVALPQLRFASFRMASPRLDSHQRDGAHAGRTKKRAGVVPTPARPPAARPPPD